MTFADVSPISEATVCAHTELYAEIETHTNESQN